MCGRIHQGTICRGQKANREKKATVHYMLRRNYSGAGSQLCIRDPELAGMRGQK